MTYGQLRAWLDENEATPAEDWRWEDIPWGVRRWLTHEVLPAIRRMGGYKFPDDLDAVCPWTEEPETAQ